MGNRAFQTNQKFTWDDYQTWSDDQRWEIIAGEAFAMSPSPTTRHQVISRELAASMHPFFRKGPCEYFVAPFDVQLSDEDIVQPDLMVVCDKNQIKRTHIEGAPKLVVEIVSESSTIHDRMRKSQLYARAGVQEYWIVTPFPSLIEVFELDGGSYRVRHVFGKDDTLSSPAFPGLSIPLADVFTFPLEPDELPRVVREPSPVWPQSRPM